MINRTIEPTSGAISIDGEDVSKQDAALLRRKIGYVIQHAGLFPHRTIVDNIATVPLLNGVNKKQAREAGGRAARAASASTSRWPTRYPAQLSGGQQQRVGVARALAADPPVMLMDEPFSAVDPIVRDGLQKEFLRLQSELGKTIAFVTHDIDEAIKLGDKVAIFRVGGHLAQVGSPQELLDDPADEFVADFVGRDRGFRALSFVTADKLEVEPVSAYVDRSSGATPGARRRRPAAGLGRRRVRRAAPAARHVHRRRQRCGWSPTSPSPRRPAQRSGSTRTAWPTGSSRTRRSPATSPRCGTRPSGEPPMITYIQQQPRRHPRRPGAAPLAGASSRSCSARCWRCRSATSRSARRWLYQPVINIGGVIYSIPSLALFAVIPADPRRRGPLAGQRGGRRSPSTRSRCSPAPWRTR